MMLWIEKTYTAYSDELASDFEFSVAFGVSGTVAVGASGAGGTSTTSGTGTWASRGCTGSGTKAGVAHVRSKLPELSASN